MVLLYASVYNDVRYVVNLSGRFDLKRGIEGRLGKDFLERIKQNGFIHVKNRRGEISNVISHQSTHFDLNVMIILFLYGAGLHSFALCWKFWKFCCTSLLLVEVSFK